MTKHLHSAALASAIALIGGMAAIAIGKIEAMATTQATSGIAASRPDFPMSWKRFTEMTIQL